MIAPKWLKDWARHFFGASMIYKAWPAVGNVHTYIHAAIEMMREHSLKASEIEQIYAYVGDFHMRMCTPLDVRRAPKNSRGCEIQSSLLRCLGPGTRGNPNQRFQFGSLGRSGSARFSAKKSFRLRTVIWTGK